MSSPTAMHVRWFVLPLVPCRTQVSCVPLRSHVYRATCGTGWQQCEPMPGRRPCVGWGVLASPEPLSTNLRINYSLTSSSVRGMSNGRVRRVCNAGGASCCERRTPRGAHLSSDGQSRAVAFGADSFVGNHSHTPTEPASARAASLRVPILASPSRPP